MTKKIVWRLGRLPEPLELASLVKDKIITQEEAREILFSSETQEDRDKKSLESEIRFLRDIVEKLSKSKTEVVKIIEQIQVPYKRWDWYQPYQIWCGSTTTESIIGGTNMAYFSTGTDNLAVSNTSSINNMLTSNGANPTGNSASGAFTAIKTF